MPVDVRVRKETNDHWPSNLLEIELFKSPEYLLKTYLSSAYESNDFVCKNCWSV